MINVNKFENRIVKFKRIDSEGNESDQEAEIRRMDYDQNEDIPRSVTARLVTPLNFIIQKATELGVQKFIPILSERTMVKDINIERVKKIIVESAEQSNRISIPEINN